MQGYYFHTVKIWVKFPYSLGYASVCVVLAFCCGADGIDCSSSGSGRCSFKAKTWVQIPYSSLGRQLGANSIHASIVQVRFLTYPVRYLNRQSLPLITGSIQVQILSGSMKEVVQWQNNCLKSNRRGFDSLPSHFLIYYLVNQLETCGRMVNASLLKCEAFKASWVQIPPRPVFLFKANFIYRLGSSLIGRTSILGVEC